MSHRRILSLWFPRLGAERVIRAGQGSLSEPLAIVEEVSNTQVISALNTAAEDAGLFVGQPLRDAHVLCANLVTRGRSPPAETAFLAALGRWAGQFSPWVAPEPPDSVTLDMTGSAHLFGGEEALLQRIEEECARMGLTVRMGLADTLGAAWALARYAGEQAQLPPVRSGDAIDQEARATRARAARVQQKGRAGRRHWTRGGAAPQPMSPERVAARIAAVGQTRALLAPLPVAALRLEPGTVAQLGRLGLRQIGDLLEQPRASLARRFGRGLILRLDQAMGSTPEPVSPAGEDDRFAVRLTLPEPIGLLEDLMAGIDRMLPRLCARLEERGKGARLLRLETHRVDQAAQSVSVGLARASRDPDRMRPLLEMKLEGIDAGFGIEMLRLEVLRAEPIHARTQAGHLEASTAARARQAGGQNVVLEDLIGRIGARIGLEAITRRHPVDTHIPEKTAKVLAAAWSDAARDWPPAPHPRPLLMWRPELVTAPDVPSVPERFRWRGRDWQLAEAEGPERIAPEWWLEDPNWRSGVRDYWVVVTDCGARLWLFFAHGAALSRGWFCHGSFA
ncbi:DNA polymerase Y family protein [Phaeobacter sp. QD34_3]|uniref:Y-family DNA polymerase n=1 Tax=unclassified Phaeobacter TaxID=2621772 RepID=UPI00237F9921|nr:MULTISPECIES: DNA polymerase Y family protein [unclassified Phaeobacter]MDE4133458.1 DNA polymerase Y family protein [Phaeobacter sp. QD34_3]MDE4137094.1 DNA polymerase Y family protein [Phaeobacter sp. QD34_24]